MQKNTNQRALHTSCANVFVRAIRPIGVIALPIVVLVLAISAAPALATVGNTYVTQFNGSTTTKAAKAFLYVGGLGVGPSEDVYVAEPEEQVVDEFNANGTTLLGEFTGATTAATFFYDTAVATNASGDVYVADDEHGVVDEFNATSSELLGEITGALTAGKSFNPYSLAVGPTGDVFVGDLEHSVVDEYEPVADGVKYTYTLVGEYSGASGGSPKGPSAKAWAPDGLAVNSSGDVYVATYSKQKVVDEFLPESLTHGAVQTKYTFVDEITGQKTTSTFSPRKVAVAPNGYVYVANQYKSPYEVERFSPAGTYECLIDGKKNEPAQCSGEATPQIPETFEPEGLAVGPSGDLYVGDSKNKYVDIFAGYEPPGQWVTVSATGLSESEATLNGTVNPEGETVTKCEFEYATEKEYQKTSSYSHTVPCAEVKEEHKSIGEEIGTGTSPVAVKAKLSNLPYATKYVFRITGETSGKSGKGKQESFTTTDKVTQPPTVTIQAAGPIGSSWAALNGQIDPNEQPTAYHFEYSVNGVRWTSLPEESIAAGASAVQVASGLTANTTYHVRLAATNTCETGVTGCGASTSPEVSFTTLAGPASLTGVGVSNLGADTATLNATIHPEGQPSATYRFEYGTNTGYGTTVPLGEGTITGTEPKQVSQTITGLEPETLYHFRVVAANGIGTATATPDQTFMTLSAGEGETPPAGACPNEARRAESNVNPAMDTAYSLGLPECRAYEMVTPPFKSYNLLRGRPYVRPGLAGASVPSISAGGSPVLLNSVPLLTEEGVAGSDEDLSGTFYLLERGEAGWTTLSASPTASVFPTAREELANPEDNAVGLWLATTPTQPIENDDIYLREASGSFVNVGPLHPPSETTGPSRGATSSGQHLDYGKDVMVGASARMNDVLFSLSEGSLWPGDGTVIKATSALPSLYEYAGFDHSGEGTDVPTLVGVDNTAKQISQCGTGLGGTTINEPQHKAVALRNGVSRGGSTVFFTALAGGCKEGTTTGSGPTANELYARLGAPGGTQATVNVAGSAPGCATSVSCNITSPVTYGGASANGSKVFFTTSQQLLSSDRDTTSDLYECELPGDGGTMPAASGLVNGCPDLKAITVTGTSTGANVQSVAGVSEEGSRVYFIAKGAITSEPDLSLPAGHQEPTAGSDNLYLWEAAGAGDPSGRITFVATLPTTTLTEAQATPNGEYLAFTSTGDLTEGDTSTVAQAFRYDAQTGELVRVSTGEEGYNENGNTNSDPATLADNNVNEEVQPRLTMSQNGAEIVFESSDALTPQAQGGTNNVYEWRNGPVYLIAENTKGLTGTDASGQNIFFLTAEKLVGQDTDEDTDLYDARVDGGFPAPTHEARCGGEVCQGALTAPLTPVIPGSSGPTVDGNLASPGLKLPGESPKATPKPKAKVKTRTEKLKAALKSCGKDKSKSRRKACEAKARKQYGPVRKSKGKAKRRKK